VTGKHVRLERLAQDHFPDLWENMGSHQDLWTWWPDGPYETREEHDKMLSEFMEFLKDDLTVWTIILVSGPKQGKGVGLALGLSEHRDSHRIGELGLFFGPDLQATRAGTEVPYLVTDLLFKGNHRRVGWKTNSLNKQSTNAAKRYGFVHEGTFRQDQINKGRSRDTAFFCVLDSEWPLCKAAFEKWLEDENFDEQQRQKRNLQEIRESLK
ncbi:acyl-CoA N-acyltransferase, partial [Mollisia scopiformis]